MKIRFLFVLQILFVQTFIFAQVNISGKVIDAKTQEGLIGASVSMGTEKTITDDNGFYSIKLSNSGLTNIDVSYVGFKTLSKQEIFTNSTYENFDFQLEEITTLLKITTVTSGKFEKALSEVTVSMEVLTPKLVENINTRKLDDALQKIPGVNIIDGQPNIRGGSGWSYGAGSRVLVLMDGIPALQADAGLTNWKDFPVENIEQVEIVKGAASALYGSSAMNGIINIRTGFAKSTPETKVSMQYTNYLTPNDEGKKWWSQSPYDGTFSIGHKQKFGKFDLAASGLYFNQSSFLKDSYEKYGRFNLNSRYRITDRFTVAVSANYNKGTSQNFFYWIDNRDSAYIGSKGSYSSSNRVRYTVDPSITYFDNIGNRHKLLGRYYRVDNALNNNQSNSSNLFYSEYQFQRKMGKTIVTAGAVATTSNTNAQLYGDTIFSALNLAGYAQADAKFGKLNISAGMRYEQNTINGPKTVRFNLEQDRSKDSIFVSKTNGEYKESRPVFRLGLNYQVANFTFLRASWGQGYRFPTIAETFISTAAGGLQIKPNPTLTSETGWTSEVGIKQGYRNDNLDFSFDGAVFWSQYSNMMEFQLSPTLTSPTSLFNFQSLNVGNTDIRGFEFTLTGEVRSGDFTSSVLMGYTYIDPTYRNFDPKRDTVSASANYNVLKYRFKHNVKFDAEIDYKAFGFGVSVQYNSFMESVDAILSPPEAFGFIEQLRPFVAFTKFRKENPNGFYLVDFRTSYHPTKKTKISVILANVMNVEYAYRPAFLEAPRNVAVRFDWKF
jgi:outer membrane receptor protein involved in Fe transport